MTQWKDSRRDCLDIEAENNNSLICVSTSEIGYNIESRATLREIIEHLQRLDREVWGEENISFRVTNEPPEQGYYEGDD